MPTSPEGREHLLDRILDNESLLVYVFDIREARMVYSNRTTYEFLGYSAEEAEAMGADFPRLITHPEDFPAVANLHREQTAEMTDKEVRESQYRVKHRTLGYRWVRNRRSVFARDALGRVTQVVSIIDDITDQEEIMDRLRVSEQRYRSIVNNISDSVIIHDVKGTILDCNEEACRQRGYSLEEMLGANLTMINAPASAALVGNNIADAIRTGSKIFDAVGLCKDGQRIPINVNLRLIAGEGDGAIFQAVVRDLSESNKVRESLAKMEKLESLARLAAGIAHEFNNLFGGIFGFIDLAREKAGDPAAVKLFLDRAIGTMDRAKYLTRYLLTFAKGGAPIKKIADLGPLILDTGRTVLDGKSAAFLADVAPDLRQCNYDKDQMAQVFQNILNNSADAMPHGGIVSVTATNYFAKQGEIAALPEGNYLRIVIADTGQGIDAESLTRIFDPFFTTRPGRSGIGLTVAHSIIAHHGGSIEVASDKGKGTAFTIYLPASEAVEPAPKRVPVAPARKPIGLGGILLMDDEAIIRESLTAGLGNFGYTVECAKDGRQALEVFRKRLDAGNPFDAAVLDLLVPGDLDGKAVAGELRKLSPDMPIIAASGYSDDPAITDPEAYGFSASVCKPFRIAELVGKIEKPGRVKA